MKVVLTYKQEITSKSGEKFVIYRGVSGSGDTVEAFLTQEQAERAGIPDTHILPPATIKALVEESRTVDVNFNQRGRVDSIDVN